jgi:hypothetical protein
MTKQTYGDNALSRSQVSEWCARFRGGRNTSKTTKTVEDQQPLEHLTRSKQFGTDFNRSLNNSSDDGRGAIRIILVEDLGKREICARFVVHCLSDFKLVKSLFLLLMRIFLCLTLS